MTRLFRVKLSLIMVILSYHKNKETFLLWLQPKTGGSFLEICYFSFVNLLVWKQYCVDNKEWGNRILSCYLLQDDKTQVNPQWYLYKNIDSPGWFLVNYRI